MPPYRVTYPGRLTDDHRIRVEMEPPKLPWPIVFYFTEAMSENGDRVFVCEGSERGAAIGLEEDGADADAAIEAAEHYKQHAHDYERMAAYLCQPTRDDQRAAEIYAARILRWRRLRRSESDRLRVRDAYRAWCAREGRHGAMQGVADELYMNRKAVRRSLEESVRRGEMEHSEIPWRRRKERTS